MTFCMSSVPGHFCQDRTRVLKGQSAQERPASSAWTHVASHLALHVGQLSGKLGLQGVGQLVVNRTGHLRLHSLFVLELRHTGGVVRCGRTQEVQDNPHLDGCT